MKKHGKMCFFFLSQELSAFCIAYSNSNLNFLSVFSELGTLEVNSNILRMIETALFVTITTVTSKLLGSYLWNC